MVQKGEFYEDKNNLYEVIDVLFHWETKERIIQFISYNTASWYVLEEPKFIKTRKKLDI